ncbi:MAG: YbaB/EbfC family nucleoid-associated protein [Halanaerobiaceae bacterium]
MDDFSNIMGEIERIKSELNQLEEELLHTEVMGQNHDGKIIAKASGKGELIEFEISDKNLDPDLNKALIQAANRALNNSRELAARKKKEIIGEVNLPEMPGLF